MSWPRKNKEQILLGLEGEEIIRNILKKKKYKFMQLDLMFLKNNKWCSGEVKMQEIFNPGWNGKSPAFYGHGLPPWQVKDRVKFYNDTGIEPYLFVVELDHTHSKNIYVQSIIKLEKGKYHITKDNPRKIYPIENFKIIGEQS